MFLPTQCPVCRSVGDAPCRRCVAQLAAAPEWRQGPLDHRELDAVVALFAYEGVGAKLVTSLKYDNHRDALAAFGVALGKVVSVAAAELGPVDRVVWVPTTRRRAGRRGFDQAELLAGVVARYLRRPCRRLLVRATQTSQTGHGRCERAMVEFEVIRPTDGRIVLVDDVRTTGASLRAAAGALRVAGAESVIGATLAARG